MANTTTKVRIPWKREPVSGEILMAVLAAGTLALGAVNPAFLAIGAVLKAFDKQEGKDTKKFRASFKYLRHRGLLRVEEKHGQVYLELTPAGKKQAQGYALAKKLTELDLKHKPKGKYLILFDVKSEDKLKRDAFRHMIKRLGCVQIQKSVWLSLHDCREEIDFLKKFFELTVNECRVITVSDLGGPIPS